MGWTRRERELWAIIQESIKQLRAMGDTGHAPLLELAAKAWEDELNTNARLAEMDAYTR